MVPAMEPNFYPRSPSRWSYRSIQTAYVAPTNHNGSRVRVWAGSDRRRAITLSWDYACNPDENHARAVAALASRLGWYGAWTLGGSEPGLVAACAIRYYPPGERADDERRAECAATLRACVALADKSQSVILVLDADTMRDVTGGAT